MTDEREPLLIRLHISVLHF